MGNHLKKMSLGSQIVVGFISVISTLIAIASLYFAPIPYVNAKDQELYDGLLEIKNIQCATARAVKLNEKDKPIVDRACEIKDLRRAK